MLSDPEDETGPVETARHRLVGVSVLMSAGASERDALLLVAERIPLLNWADMPMPLWLRIALDPTATEAPPAPMLSTDEEELDWHRISLTAALLALSGDRPELDGVEWKCSPGAPVFLMGEREQAVSVTRRLSPVLVRECVNGPARYREAVAASRCWDDPRAGSGVDMLRLPMVPRLEVPASCCAHPRALPAPHSQQAC